MNTIQVLDPVTIDKIAAGEVIERPSSVVKEMVENAVDAGATSITVEIQDGGISFLRVADNGCGIPKEQVRAAFLRHSTSKIRSVEDLSHLNSLGFRGEALSSIAAVSQVEVLTKAREAALGIRYCINGGKEVCMEEAGTPDGTTFLVRQLFYNVPARKKFLKTPMTEASHVGELLMRLALSRPDVSFQFINNGQPKIHTSGNGELREVIYHLYGREIAANLIGVHYEKSGILVEGFLGAPAISRGNRNFEIYFINQRYIKNSMVYKAIEDAYKDFSMQRRFPFVVLDFRMDGKDVDVNVHPAKMEIRFHRQQEVYNAIFEAVSQGLHEKERIPEVTVDISPHAEAVPPKDGNRAGNKPLPSTTSPVKDLDYFMRAMRERVEAYHAGALSAEVRDKSGIFRPEVQAGRIRETVGYRTDAQEGDPDGYHAHVQGKEMTKERREERQMDLFDDRLLEREHKADYTLIGQLFETYWLVESGSHLYIIDQHAAHERVLYERTLKGMKDRTYTSQMISPPIILDLTMQEAELFEKNRGQFEKIGFEIENFGEGSYAVRAVPDNLFSIAKKELLMEMIDELSSECQRSRTTVLLDEKIASMSCKAAVKGNMKLSAKEADALIGELLLLENPYHCPHGRPTIISMSKRELEKKFKRIV